MSRILERLFVGIMVGFVLLAIGTMAVVQFAPEKSAIETIREASVRVSYGRGGGSGVVLREDGLIITAGHVCKDKTEMTVIDWRDTEVAAVVLWVGRAEDLCLLDAGGDDWTAVDIQATEPAFGDALIHVGEMMGFRQMISHGVMGVHVEVRNQDRFQFTGTAGPGSSGGGVFTEDGRLVGLIVSGKSIALGPYRIPVGVGNVLPASEILRALGR